MTVRRCQAAGWCRRKCMATEAGEPLQVVVDLNLCQGYAQCCFLAPGVFELHGQEALWYDPAPDPAQRARVQAAAAACPVQAIKVAGPGA